MKTIELTKGLFALVDDQDFQYLSQWKWNASESQSGRFYARRMQGREPVYMHRVVAARSGFGRFTGSDHKNRNTLDNQRSNLRPCSRSQNNQNRSKSTGLTSRFKGVSWFKPAKLWRASIKLLGKQHSLGYFHDEKKAAEAYDKAAIEKFGEFAVPNL